MCLQDAGNGVRGVEGTNGYASGVSVGASWNRQLTLDRATYMGAEFKAKGGMTTDQEPVHPTNSQADHSLLQSTSL